MKLNGNILLGNTGIKLKEILEEGSNDNGNYIRCGNGILICYIKRKINLSVTTKWNNFYIADLSAINYPYVFINIPVEMITINRAGGRNGWIMCASANTNKKTSTAYVVSPENWTQECEISYVAFGRWK